MLKKKFNELLTKYNIIYTIIFDLDNESFKYIGDKQKLKYKGLVENLFGDANKAIKLNNSLDREIMPQSWKQGELTSLVLKPEDNIIIGMFYEDNLEIFESYNLQEKINNEVMVLWKNN